MAYATSLVFVQGIIALVGLAVAMGNGGFSRVVVRTMQAAVPGPGGELLTNTVQQAQRAGVSHRYAGLIFGLVGALITGSTLLGQIERGLNRIYGVEQDRPTLHKYGLALVLTVTVGALSLAAFVLLAFGQSIGTSLHNGPANDVWSVARWPAALLLAMFAITLLFKWSPRRRQPSLSWLMFGAAVATIGWLIVTVVLGLFFAVSHSFGQTYGPLAGVVALLLWSLFSAIAILFGAAVAAQLEATRAGVRAPQDPEKIEHSEPDEDPKRPIARLAS
jgi:YihY family inner membrane protein